MSRTVVNLVALDDISPEKIKEAESLGVKIYKMSEVMESGTDAQGAPDYVEPKPEDCYILSYTSGTTGDPKGVKMTHKQMLSCGYSDPAASNMNRGDSVLSFLPMPHSYEQICLTQSLLLNLKIGFFCGDITKLIEDCQVLKPSIFPTVPRLMNKLYAKIKAGFDSATGCKGWLLN